MFVLLLNLPSSLSRLPLSAIEDVKRMVDEVKTIVELRGVKKIILYLNKICEKMSYVQVMFSLRKEVLYYCEVFNVLNKEV